MLLHGVGVREVEKGRKRHVTWVHEERALGMNSLVVGVGRQSTIHMMTRRLYGTSCLPVLSPLKQGIYHMRLEYGLVLLKNDRNKSIFGSATQMVPPIVVLLKVSGNQTGLLLPQMAIN